MQDIGYVVTITIGKCLGAVTGVGDAFSVFQRDVNGVISESEEDIFSSGGTYSVEDETFDIRRLRNSCATELITAQFIIKFMTAIK